MKGWALVTGSAHLVGRAIALELAGHGWDIVVHYHRSADAAKALAEEIHALGQDAVLAEIDLSNAQLAENLIPSLAEELGMIDVLVNNAGLYEEDDKDADGSRHQAVNADAPRLLGKAFRAHMAKGDRGVIINVLDAAYLSPDAAPVAPYAAYGKSEVFLAEMTRNMAKSFSPQIRVNGVAAGRGKSDFSAFATAVRQLIETPSATGQIITVA